MGIYQHIHICRYIHPSILIAEKHLADFVILCLSQPTGLQVNSARYSTTQQREITFIMLSIFSCCFLFASVGNWYFEISSQTKQHRWLSSSPLLYPPGISHYLFADIFPYVSVTWLFSSSFYDQQAKKNVIKEKNLHIFLICTLIYFSPAPHYPNKGPATLIKPLLFSSVNLYYYTEGDLIMIPCAE